MRLNDPEKSRIIRLGDEEIDAVKWLEQEMDGCPCCVSDSEGLRQVAELIELLYDELEYVKYRWWYAGMELGRAFCEGEGWDHDYGWPTGEHTEETMADSIIERLKAK